MSTAERARILGEDTDKKMHEMSTLFEAHVERVAHANARRRLLYRYRKEGLIPPPNSLKAFVRPLTRAHHLLKYLEVDPAKLKDINERDSYQFLRLLRLDLIYIGVDSPKRVYLNRPPGEDVLKQLDAGSSATIWLDCAID